jgi:hypothetical protein
MASVKTRAARQGNGRLVEGFSALLSHRDLISRFHEVRLLVPNAMRDEAGMRSRLLSGRALMPKEIPGRDLPDQVEIISLHGLQTPAFPGSSWNSLDVVFASRTGIFRKAPRSFAAAGCAKPIGRNTCRGAGVVH